MANKFKRVIPRPGYYPAQQFDGTDASALELRHWIGALGTYETSYVPQNEIDSTMFLIIEANVENLGTIYRIRETDWVIKGWNNKFHVMSDAEFKNTYEVERK